MTSLYADIDDWLTKTSFKGFVAEIERTVIGQKNLVTICANVYSYLQNVLALTKINHNTIIAAPSGSGKTQTYRALKEYFAAEIPLLPVCIFDLANLTPSGYRGSEASEIVAPLFKQKTAAPIGIIFLDEFDKKLTPSITAAGSDVNMEAQNSILTLLEGGMVQNKMLDASISTENVMFIGLGSFDAFRKTKENVPKPVGFNTADTANKREHFEYIKREDVIEQGGSYELIGRFPILVNYDKLSEDAIYKIIEKYTYEIANAFDIELILKESMLDELMANANSNFGCRLIDSLIRNIVLKTYADAKLNEVEDFQTIVITVENSHLASYEYKQMSKEEIFLRYS